MQMSKLYKPLIREKTSLFIRFKYNTLIKKEIVKKKKAVLLWALIF